MWQGWINIAVGVWLIICGFVPQLQTPAGILIPGIVSVIFGFWGAGRVNSWQGTVNGIIGIWLFLSGVAFGLAVPWNFFISGIVVGILAIWNTAEHAEPGHTVSTAH